MVVPLEENRSGFGRRRTSWRTDSRADTYTLREDAITEGVVMSRKLLAAAGGFLLVIGALAAYVWFSGGSGEPSTEVTAPPVAPVHHFGAAPPTSASVSETTVGEQAGARTVSQP